MSAIQKPLTKITEFPVQEVAIRSIEILPDLLQTRAKTDAGVVKVYSDAKAAGSVFPPVVVFETPDGRKLLADGFHRVEAWRKLGLRAIKAVLRPGTMEDAILFGIEANFAPTNIRQVTEDDRQHAVKIMLRNEVFRDWSDAEIGRRCSIGNMTVTKIRLRLRDEEGVPLPEKVVGFKNGLPTKKLCPYKKNLGGLPKLYRARDKHTAQVNGIQVCFPKDPSSASEKLKEAVQSIEKMRAILGRPGAFTHWASARSLNISGRPSTLGGFTFRDCVWFTVSESDHDSLLRVIAKAVLSRVESPEASRTIIIGYVGNSASHAPNLARQLTPPIEFLTPEEVMAEFGPGGENGQPDPSPEPSPS